MASRPLRLLLLAIAIELFAVEFAFSIGIYLYFVGRLVAFAYFVGRLVAFALGVTGLVVALAGYRARE